MIGRVAAVAFAQRASTKKDILEDPDLMRVLATKANFYKFRTLPLSMWIFSAVLLAIAIYLTYYLRYIVSKKESVFLVYVATFIFYITSFVSFYTGKIEIVVIDKKKGIIKQTLWNVFLSKVEYVKQIDNLFKVDMVKDGAKRYAGDTTYYIMRLTFKDKSKIEFGKTFSFYEIQKKYRACKALLNGEIIVEEGKMHWLVDESIDFTDESSPFFYNKENYR